MKDLNLIDTSSLQRYLTYRALIDDDLEFILSLTSMLSQYRDCCNLPHTHRINRRKPAGLLTYAL